MPGSIIASILSGKLECDLLCRWLKNDPIEAASDDCVLVCSNTNEFVVYFLSYLRTQTDSILQTNSNALLHHQGTPEKSLSQRQHHRSISDPTCDNDKSNDSLTVKSDKKTQESPNRERKKQGRRVKTKLFTDEKSKEHNQSLSTDESRVSLGVERLMLSSTPMKNGFKEYPQPLTSPVTPHSRSFNFERCDTPRLVRHSRSQDKSVSLADYLVNVQPKSSKKRRSKNVSNDDSETKVDLDLSNSEIFPEIGARKSSSLKSERRRIKPTNIDRSKKSYSLNSFTPEAFQQPSLGLEENLAFKPNLQSKESSNTFEAERHILKQERHKLMEKFNILNMSTSPKVSTPQIKITQKDSIEKNHNYIEANFNKVLYKDKIDILVEIYDVLLKNNLILNVNTEIYFLVTILLSKQLEEDYRLSESQIQVDMCDNILKPIHNSTYFAVKSLWNERGILEVILDKNSLKILGENKKVRSFYPELAKFLLNSYGLKCEAESNSDRSKIGCDSRCSNGMVCFNLETDNAENFPSMLSFQNFKKQRDMFYEILRWYQDCQNSGLSRSSLRARIKALLCTGTSAANYAHLAALFTQMLLDSLPPNEQESKLSKLQRRLTCSSASESNRLPHFSDKEMFYKEFVMYSENESFRVHLRDALASEIIALDSTPLGNESSNEADISKEFLQISKKLGLLSKFLGYLTSLPYAQIPVDVLLKTGILIVGSQKEIFTAPKEKVLENNIALRNYSQPAIDLNGILTTAYENGRLSVTLPWIVHYISMLDYTTLRLKYYQNLLNILFHIYKLKFKHIKKNTLIYLKSALGWLFDLPHFPQEAFYEKSECSVINFNIDNIDIKIIDSYDLIDESILFELCPYLKDVNVLVSTSRVIHDKDAGSFRHITPVSLSMNSEDRIRSKEKELQIRLEEELIKSQPSSTRRVLELVTERVASGAVKDLTAHALAEARRNARKNAIDIVHNCKDKTLLLPTLQAMYNDCLSRLRSEALETCRSNVRQRVSTALVALLPNAPPPLHAVAARACYSRLTKWTNDHWSTTVVLCKNIEDEMNSLLALGDSANVTPNTETASVLAAEFHSMHSPAHTIIILKEQICLLLDYEEIPDPSAVLESCVNCCQTSNVLSRPPAQRAILQLSIDFCLVYLSRHKSKISEILPKLHTIWDTCCPDRKPNTPEDLDPPERRLELSPTFRNFEDERAPTPQSDEEVIDVKEIKVIEVKEIKVLPSVETPSKQAQESESNGLLEFFDRILCPRNIVLLSDTKCKASEVWEALADVLVFLLKNNYLTEDSLTEQCLAVYRQDWPQNILENLSTCMKSVSSRWSRSSTGKFTLFLDFLADYCNDMDYDLVE
ncbi:codanin-1 isoform X1 [Maniola hyperantus]|uniref:codanin-1 isoform X1 n=1 Tax=Aphantopus hyperantus TaxID=2795564 RepID=UPI00156A38F5|nr:codanin-1 [Maniola hyperantus]